MANEPAKSAAMLLERSAKAERKLIRREEFAEKAVKKAAQRLARAEEMLALAQARVDRRRAALSEAENELRKRQTERALGPDDGGSPIQLNGAALSEQPANMPESATSGAPRSNDEREQPEVAVV
jgi:hypothetical protein